MNEQMISELEAAAKIIMAPPNMVSNEQRHNAEAVIMNFRNMKSPFSVCKQILDTSSVDYVLFEAAEVMKRALIREWTFLLQSDKESMGHYLLHYVTNREVPSFVRDRLLQVISIMVKRNSVDDGGRQRTSILNEVENLISNGEHPKKLLGCSMVLSLMQEYATTVKSADVGLAWEVHFKAKKQFEATDLKRIFKFCIMLLSNLSRTDPPFDENLTQLTKQLLKILEGSLTWGYISAMLPKRLIGIYESVYESDQAPALRPSEVWSEVMFAPELLPTMFEIYWKVRYSDDLAHHAITCLVQLASLNGDVMKNDDARLAYLTSYMENFSKLVSSVTIKNKESLGISNIIRKLTLFFLHDLTKINETLQFTYLDELTRLTCSFIQGAAQEESNADENKYYNDAFDNMLEAWASLLQEYTEYNGMVNEHATCIFNAYLQCHLAPPDGTRQNNDSEVEDIEDNEDNDRTKYKDQLQTIGMFGRIIPNHSLQVIFRLLENSIEKLKVHLQNMQNSAMTISQATALDNLFEDIHWAILIAGHILCMDSDGETPMIPSEIMQFSLEQAKSTKTNLDSSLKCLAAVNDITTQLECTERCDYVIRIFCDVLKLSVVENSAADVKLGHFMSPEVSCSIMWFLKRWCLSYLLPVENYYQEISPTLIGAVGRDTEGANFVINFILGKIQSNICHFSSEPILLKDTVELFADIVCVKQKSMYIVKSQGLWNLINIQNKVEAGQLPPNIRRGIYKGFVLAGSSLQDPTEANNYYTQILKPIQTRFKTLISKENFQRLVHEKKSQEEIIDILECLIGVAKGSQMATVHILFEFLAPILSELTVLLGICNNYQVIVQLVLELFGQSAKNMLCFLSHLDSKRLYESTLAAVQTYAKCNANRLSNETFAEESSFQDLALVLDLLTFILSKDCLDFCPTTTEEEITITASDVSLFGLNFIMPLMTLDLLKYPSLCAQYYRLLVLINDIFPEKICNLPVDLLTQLLWSIEIGLTQFGSDVVQACLDFVQGMASYMFKHGSHCNNFYTALKPFLKLLMDLTLTQQINSDLLSTASTCLYALICCYKDEYESLVKTLIQSQSDPLNAERLSAAFLNLTANIELNGERQPKLKFRDNFDRFIANVHGFLLVK